MSNDADGDDDKGYVRVGEVDVCWYCKRVVEGTAGWAIEHFKECVEPRRKAVSLPGNPVKL